MKYVPYLCLLLLGLSTGIESYAQEEEKIETDRPNVTDIPQIVPKKYLQIEAGVYTEETTSSRNFVSHPLVVMRYGLSRRFELRLQTQFSTVREHYIPNDKVLSGLEPLEVGFKASLVEGKGFIPHTSILFQTAIPSIASKDFKAEHLAPMIRACMENQLDKRTSLTYNFGTEWDGTDPEPEWMYSITPGIDLGQKWHVFAEAYGFLKRKESPEHTLDAGLEYFVNRNFAIDICSGFGLNKSAQHYFITIGGSIRFK